MSVAVCECIDALRNGQLSYSVSVLETSGRKVHVFRRGLGTEFEQNQHVYSIRT